MINEELMGAMIKASFDVSGNPRIEYFRLQNRDTSKHPVNPV